MEAARQREEEKRMELEAKRLEIAKRLESKEQQPEKKRLSRRAQKRLDKLMADKTKSDLEKQLLRDEMLGAIEQIAGNKRQRLADLKDPRNFISGDRPGAEGVGDNEGGG